MARMNCVFRCGVLGVLVLTLVSGCRVYVHHRHHGRHHPPVHKPRQKPRVIHHHHTRTVPVPADRKVVEHQQRSGNGKDIEYDLHNDMRRVPSKSNAPPRAVAPPRQAKKNPAGVPPGLAKKNPAKKTHAVPRGHAKKRDTGGEPPGQAKKKTRGRHDDD